MFSQLTIGPACQTCGKTLRPSKAGPQPSFCKKCRPSYSCYQRDTGVATCRVCGQAFRRNHGAQKKCAGCSYGKRYCQSCKCCGRDFLSTGTNTKFCSDLCRAWSRWFVGECCRCGRTAVLDGKVNEPACKLCFKKDRNLQQNVAGRIRRARMETRVAGRRYRVGQFSFADVWNRSDGICGLCGEPVDLFCQWPNPLSPSVDHIVPLSKGGVDAIDNVQIAHLGCNSRKRDKEQADAST